MASVAKAGVPGARSTAPTPAAGSAAKNQAEAATSEQMASIKRLAQIIARIFYDDGHILLVDQLVGVPVCVKSRRVCADPQDPI